MTHRAETILNTVETLLTGLATTGSQVTRGRVWPVDAFPAISIFKGADRRDELDDILDEFLTRVLTINIEIHTTATGNPETQLNQVAAEVFAALAADKTLGLAYVFNTLLEADDEPIIDDSQDTPVASMISTWNINYQHSLTSAES